MNPTSRIPPHLPGRTSPRPEADNPGPDALDAPTPAANPDDLAAKYLPEKKEEPKEAARQAAAVHAVLAILGGIVLIVIGVMLTQGSRDTVYYGLIWVGVATILEGFCCAVSGTKYGDLHKAVHVVCYIVGLIIAFVILFATMEH